MADFELLAPGGHQKLVDEVEDRLDLKADIDGYYAQLTAGAADNLTGRGDTTTAEFLYRTAGGTADIETGQAVAKSIHGRTLRWNQLIQARSQSTTYSGVATVYATDGSVTFNGTSTVSGGIGGFEVSVINGHKYLMKSGGSSTAPSFGAASTGWDSGDGKIITFSGSTGTTWFVFNVTADATYTNAVLHPQLFDLTAMFGAGNEPSTVAEFEALFPLPYYEYDAGSLLSVNMAGIETVGFNQYPLAEIPLFKGGYAPAFDKSQCFVALGNNQYRVQIDGVSNATTWRFGIVTYEMDETPTSGSAVESVFSQISYSIYKTSFGYMGNDNGTTKAFTFTTNRNVYVRLYVIYGDTNAASRGISPCVHLVWSGRRNGEYEPFWSSQREIAASTYFPDGMRSAGTVRDELTSTEAIQRVYKVVLDGTQAGLRFTVNPSGGQSHDLTIVSVMGAHWVQSGLPEPLHELGAVVCDKIPTNSAIYTGWTGKSISAWTDNSVAFLIIPTGDNSITTEEQFVEWLQNNPLTIHYAIKTPTVTPIDPALNLSYRVDDFGTERVMVPTGENSAPPVLDIAYGLNVVDFVRRAPSEYISAASFRQYLLARDAHDGTTTTMTWDDTDNRYEFAITDTVTEG